MERERHCRCEAGNQVTISRPAPNTALCRDAFDSRHYRLETLQGLRADR
jgi:hypothetical protein